MTQDCGGSKLTIPFGFSMTAEIFSPKPSLPGRVLVWSLAPQYGGTSWSLAAGNANSTTSEDITDIGGGPAFYDNLVQVRAVSRDEIY
jgi:hypothetical protein